MGFLRILLTGKIFNCKNKFFTNFCQKISENHYKFKFNEVKILFSIFHTEFHWIIASTFRSNAEIRWQFVSRHQMERPAVHFASTAPVWPNVRDLVQKLVQNFQAPAIDRKKCFGCLSFVFHSATIIYSINHLFGKSV